MIDKTHDTNAPGPSGPVQGADPEPAWDEDDFTVRLERVFSGPMDLLLHLVREHEVEIHEIEIHAIVRDYLEYLKHLTDVDIEAAGDFVLMAATLMAIKSRSLIPKEELDLEEELDPRDELIERLMEFRRFRGAAEDLEERLLERAKLSERGWHGDVKASRPEKMLDLGDLTAWDLLGHWSRLQRETQMNQPRHIAGERRPLRFYVNSLAGVLKRRKNATLREIVESDFGDGPLRDGLIGSFQAVLELAKLGLVSVRQDAITDEIQLTLSATSDEEIDEILASATIDEEVDEEAEAEAEAAVAELARASEAGGEAGHRELGLRELGHGELGHGEAGALDELGVDGASGSEFAIDEVSADEPSVDEPSVDEPSVDEPSVGEPSVETASADTTHADAFDTDSAGAGPNGADGDAALEPERAEDRGDGEHDATTRADDGASDR